MSKYKAHHYIICHCGLALNQHPTCKITGKYRYSQKHAQIEMKTILEREESEGIISDYFMSVYHCNPCGGWHIGRKRKPKLQQLVDFIRAEQT